MGAPIASGAATDADAGVAASPAASTDEDRDSRTVLVRTTDGVELTFVAAPGEPVLDAAAAAGSTLLSLCRKGTCGVCRAHLVSGTVEHGDHTDDALSAAEEEAGGVLLCCASPTSDVVVDLPYDRAKVLDGAVPERAATVVGLDRWPGDVVRFLLQVEPDEFGTAMQFDAGQFAELTPPGGEESRAYSFANTGNWEGGAEFMVRLRPGGYFSEYARDRAAVGDRLALVGPQGAFTLRENGLRPRWMVCGGTGLAPLISMLRRMAEWGDPQDALLVLGVNRPGEVFATAELDELHAALPALRTLVPVVEPDADWAGPVGTAVDVLAAELDALPPGSERPDVYLCGSPGFLAAARACAEARGVPEDQVYAERILAN